MNTLTNGPVTGRIPLADLKGQHESIREELSAAIEEVVSSCGFVGGPVVRAFAKEFATYCGVKRAVPCSNGTEALRLALVGVLGQGDGSAEVISVSHTFAATTEAIVAAGYKPVLVDVSPDTHLMDLDLVEAARTERTVAVVPVHLYGQMVDMPRLRAWADRMGLPIVEDAAQAHGARFEGSGPGQIGTAASFSFYPGKNLGALGDAGAVITNDDAVADRIAQLVDHGRTDKYTHAIIGGNARMDGLQAAALRVKLHHLDAWNDARRKVAGWYDELLADHPNCRQPVVARGAFHVYHQYVVQVEHRSDVQAGLAEEGIATGIHYPIPVHEQPAFADLGLAPEDLPATHALCRRILSLPIHPGLSQDDAARVAGELGRLAKPLTPAVV